MWQQWQQELQGMLVMVTWQILRAQHRMTWQ
jgi:hypothetical protein